MAPKLRRDTRSGADTRLRPKRDATYYASNRARPRAGAAARVAVALRSGADTTLRPRLHAAAALTLRCVADTTLLLRR